MMMCFKLNLLLGMKIQEEHCLFVLQQESEQKLLL